MRSDLTNMRLGCMILDIMHVDIGFDMTSVIREYCVQVRYYVHTITHGA